MTERQDKNLNIVRTKRAFKVKEKAFFIIFKGLSVVFNYTSRATLWQKNIVVAEVTFQMYSKNFLGKTLLGSFWAKRGTKRAQNEVLQVL